MLNSVRAGIVLNTSFHKESTHNTTLRSYTQIAQRMAMLSLYLRRLKLNWLLRTIRDIILPQHLLTTLVRLIPMREFGVLLIL